uniref:Gamma-aminobutyric acid type A receptor subunit alpha1 n=1 Tax=Pipistrellus kuhlii TaxID=59472 RepID=A0A7J7XA34_PIPKU|nr:gamma-aminobutyric acid type A receptor subunit alpha1 [Pipistrellus kuhlii]
MYNDRHSVPSLLLAQQRVCTSKDRLWSNNCAHHDNFEHQCQEFAPEGGLCNCYGLVYRSVLCLCVLCSD